MLTLRTTGRSLLGLWSDIVCKGEAKQLILLVGFRRGSTSEPSARVLSATEGRSGVQGHVRAAQLVQVINQ